ncbi:UNVERIFIED_CONTAM: Glutamate synthase domain 3 [Acetivibrio alkalicellulosi]
MEYLDALKIKSTQINNMIEEKLIKDKELIIQNPHSMHNIATGLAIDGKVTIKGSTGFYTGGFLEGASVIVEGNAGWYAGDNMMDGELIITKNAGCNAGTYLYGGTIVIRGSAGSRVGYGMKGGTIIVCGSAGRWAGQMTLGGKLILLGKVGKQLGESMYKGVIYIQDEEAKNNLGGNVFIDKITPTEVDELNTLFKKYDIDAKGENFVAIRPMTTGRHTYVLFNPDLTPEKARKELGKNPKKLEKGVAYE